MSRKRFKGPSPLAKRTRPSRHQRAHCPCRIRVLPTIENTTRTILDRSCRPSFLQTKRRVSLRLDSRKCRIESRHVIRRADKVIDEWTGFGDRLATERLNSFSRSYIRRSNVRTLHIANCTQRMMRPLTSRTRFGQACKRYRGRMSAPCPACNRTTRTDYSHAE